QSVRAVLTYSWHTLPAHLQNVLLHLALFPHDFSLEAALTILPDMTMLDLATLLDKSLLHSVPQGRYTMHELLRQFVQQQLASPPQSFQVAYSRYYLALVA